MGARGDCLLIQFARAPVAGAVKTRMLPSLTPEQACKLHRELVLWTCDTLVGARLGAVQLAVTGARDDPLFLRCLERGAGAIVAQRGRDLGERMLHALADGLAHYDSVMLVGSDCPDIDRDYLALALAQLAEVQVVLGPARDGGYVLIGARRVEPALFRDINWGSDTVYADTVARLEGLGLSWADLPPLADIDRPQDLAHWRRLRQSRG